MSEDATGSGLGNLGGASSTPATGGATAAGVAGGAGGVVGRVPNGGASVLGRLTRGVLPVHDHEFPSTGGVIDYLRTVWGTDHLADPDAHDQYLTEGEADLRYQTLPLPAPVIPDEYLTETEGDLAYAAVDHSHPQVTTGEYHFQTNPAMTDPGSGNFRSNTGAAATATALAMDQLGAGGTDITTLFQAMRLNDTIFVQDKNDAVQWVRYQLTGAATLNSGWAQVPVAVIGSGGTIAGSQLCVMQLTLTAGGGGGGASVVAADPVWDAKGDLVAATGADAGARLAVGTDGQFLTAASAQATGLAWAANPVTAHAALPNAHHAQSHDHTAADGSGALTNEAHDGYSQYANLGADPSTPATNTIRLYSKDNGSGVATLYYLSESGQIYELPTLVTGGNGSGAPANATYVTLAAETKLSAETALGAGVIMSGLLASRPAFGTAGRLYLGTDTDLVYRDTGSAWETFATRTVGGAGTYLPLAGGTMSGPLVHQANVASFQATSAANVALEAKVGTEANARLQIRGDAQLNWGPGASTTPDTNLRRSAIGELRVTNTLLADTAVKVGSVNMAAAGAVRLANAAVIGWRNAAAGGDLSLGMNASDQLALAVGTGSLTTSATAGAAGDVPSQVVGYLTVVLNGTARKLPYYAT